MPASCHSNSHANSPTGEPKPRCRMCRHYYITHDVNFPYGCRELAFKSAREPMRDVLESSGENCLYFSPNKLAR